MIGVRLVDPSFQLVFGPSLTNWDRGFRLDFVLVGPQRWGYIFVLEVGLGMKSIFLYFFQDWGSDAAMKRKYMLTQSGVIVIRRQLTVVHQHHRTRG